jgi:long-chain acyl-CoA synthetase
MAIVGPKLDRPIELANLLEVGLKSKPDEAALVLLDRTWSWRELEEDATRLARQYLAMGLAPNATSLSGRCLVNCHMRKKPLW